MYLSANYSLSPFHWINIDWGCQEVHRWIKGKMTPIWGQEHERLSPALGEWGNKVVVHFNLIFCFVLSNSCFADLLCWFRMYNGVVQLCICIYLFVFLKIFPILSLWDIEWSSLCCTIDPCCLCSTSIFQERKFRQREQ